MKKNIFAIYVTLNLVAIIILTIFNIVKYREVHTAECEINNEIKVYYEGIDPYDYDFYTTSLNRGKIIPKSKDGKTTINLSGDFYYRIKNLKKKLPNVEILTNGSDKYTYNIYYNNEIIKTNYIDESAKYIEYKILRVGKNMPYAFNEINVEMIEFDIQGEGTYIIELIFELKVNGSIKRYVDKKEIIVQYKK